MRGTCLNMMKTNSIICHRFLSLKSNIITCNLPSNTRTVTRKQATHVLTVGATGKWVVKCSKWKKRSTKSRPSSNTFKKTATIITTSQRPRILWTLVAQSPQSPTSTMTHPSTRTSRAQTIFTVSIGDWTSHPASICWDCSLKTLILQIFNRNRASLNSSSRKGLTHRRLINLHPLMRRSNLKVNIKMTSRYQPQY